MLHKVTIYYLLLQTSILGEGSAEAGISSCCEEAKLGTIFMFATVAVEGNNRSE